MNFVINQSNLNQRMYLYKLTIFCCRLINFINLIQLRSTNQIIQLLNQEMIYDPLLMYSYEPIPYSSLSKVNPEIIDCIVRSDLPSYGSLYVSNLEGVENIETLKRRKVTSILTCAEGYKLDHSPILIPNYRYFPLPENPIFGLNEYFAESSDYLKDSLSKSNCVVHCFTGQSKSIAVIIAYLMKYHNMALDEATLYVRRKKNLVNLSPRCLEGLKQYEKFLQNSSLKNSRKITQTQKSEISHRSQKVNYDSLNNSKTLKPQQNSDNKSRISQRSQVDKSYSNEDNKSIVQESRVSIKNYNYGERNKSSEISSQHHSRIVPSNNNSRVVQDKNVSRIKTQNKSRIITQFNPQPLYSSLVHNEPTHFDPVVSSNHIEYVGVKRDFKNSKNSLRKEMGSTINFQSISYSPKKQSPQNNIDYLGIQRDYTKSNASDRKSRVSQQKSHIRTEKSDIRSQNQSLMLITKERQNTKRTQMDQNNRNAINVFNPQHEENQKSHISYNSSKVNHGARSKRQASSMNHSTIQNSRVKTGNEQLEFSKILSAPFDISPSKKQYFSKVNEQLNSNVEEISNIYETEIIDLRTQYQNRLRHLRPAEKTVKQ